MPLGSSTPRPKTNTLGVARHLLVGRLADGLGVGDQASARHQRRQHRGEDIGPLDRPESVGERAGLGERERVGDLRFHLAPRSARARSAGSSVSRTILIGCRPTVLASSSASEPVLVHASPRSARRARASGRSCTSKKRGPLAAAHRGHGRAGALVQRHRHVVARSCSAGDAVGPRPRAQMPAPALPVAH